ncbi:hypothetical protein R1flu_003443 [Riccia fluitans]|uniref:Uncharacterized protein n=1 Tax=Riccia fluitans TaxID=41844 RepID=A0ABD1Y948_9MARC
MASEHDFHLGPKTAHAQGDLMDKTESHSTSAAVGGAQSKAADAADSASQKARESQEHAGNIFQKAGGAIQNTVKETVEEVQEKLGNSNNPAKAVVED